MKEQAESSRGLYPPTATARARRIRHRQSSRRTRRPGRRSAGRLCGEALLGARTPWLELAVLTVRRICREETSAEGQAWSPTGRASPVPVAVALSARTSVAAERPHAPGDWARLIASRETLFAKAVSMSLRSRTVTDETCCSWRVFPAASWASLRIFEARPSVLGSFRRYWSCRSRRDSHRRRSAPGSFAPAVRPSRACARRVAPPKELERRRRFAFCWLRREPFSAFAGGAPARSPRLRRRRTGSVGWRRPLCVSAWAFLSQSLRRCRCRRTGTVRRTVLTGGGRSRLRKAAGAGRRTFRGPTLISIRRSSLRPRRPSRRTRSTRT